MESKNFFSKILENWPIKIICVALAIFIYIFHTISSLEKKTFDVPVEIINDGLMTTASFVPNYAKVTIRTTQTNMVHINAQTMLRANIYLNNYTSAGKVEVPVNVELLDQSIMIDPLEVTVAPEKISVVLDDKIQRYIQIEPMLYGDVDSNYKISHIKVSPSSVKVIGPKSIVDNTKQIYTTKVNVKGAVKSFSIQVGLDQTSSLIKVIPEDIIRVSVTVDYRSDTKVYQKVQLLVQNLDESLEIVNAIPLVSFEITGPKNEVVKYKLSDKTVYINCSKITAAGRYELPVKFYFPPKISLKSSNVDKISIQVIEKPKPQAPEDTQEEGVKELPAGDGFLNTSPQEKTEKEKSATSSVE